METALQTTNGDVVNYTPEIDILGSMINLRPSNLDLIQLTSRMQGAIPGKFRDSVTEEHYTSVTVVPLSIEKGRVMFPPEKDDFTLKPLCRSNDAIVPSPYVETPQSSTCKACRYSQWSKVGGKNIKPECQEKYTLLVIVKESELPRYLQFKGSGIVPFMNFMRRIETDRVKARAKDGRKPNLFEYFFTLSSQEVITKTGKYYIPVFSDVNRVADPDKFGPFYNQYVRDAVRGREEEEQSTSIDVSVDSIIGASTGVHEAEFVDA